MGGSHPVLSEEGKPKLFTFIFVCPFVSFALVNGEKPETGAAHCDRLFVA